MTTSPSSRMRVQDVSLQRLAQLHSGMPTTTLVEGLAMDFAALMRSTLPDAGETIAQAMAAASGEGISRRMALAGRLLMQAWGGSAVARLQAHSSDTVRGWACYAIGAVPDMPLTQRLLVIQPLADDAHFGVREWAWLAMRGHIASDLATAIAALAAWTGAASPRIRRFASEATRPRGVWCAHLPELKRQPALALPVLEPLRSDPDVYVQDSVGNWLNDASKDQPEWVRCICQRWQNEAQNDEAHAAATHRISKRALRSLLPSSHRKRT